MGNFYETNKLCFIAVQDDFISISGSKMRKLAAIGAKPCPPTIPSDLIAAKCIPPGFMVQKGWEIVSDYYIRQKTGDWVPYSKQLGGLALAPSVRPSAERPFGRPAVQPNDRTTFWPFKFSSV